MTAFTITPEAFNTVHNALCALRNTVVAMDQSLIKVDRLDEIVDQFEQGLAMVYSQESAEFDTKMNHYDSVKTELGLTSVWSLFDVKDLNSEHPYTDALILTYQDHWGEQGPVTVSIDGSLWRDLYRAADRAIRLSGDQHHIFVEGFRSDHSTELRLITGS